MSQFVRGRVYLVELQHIDKPKYFVVVSNNRRNRTLPSALGVRITSQDKPSMPSIVPLSEGEILQGCVMCDDITELWDDEIKKDIGALSSRAMYAVNEGLKAALALD